MDVMVGAPGLGGSLSKGAEWGPDASDAEASLAVSGPLGLRGRSTADPHLRVDSWILDL